MDVAQFVQLVNGCEHLTDVKSSMLFLQNARVIQQRPEVSSGYVFHSKVDVFGILESIEKLNQPRRLGRSQDISLNENMANLTSYKPSIATK